MFPVRTGASAAGYFLTSGCTTITCGVTQRPALVILAAGVSSRFGSAKQLEPVGPGGEAMLDYAVYDAARAGFSDMVLVIRPEMEGEFRSHMDRLLGGPARLAYAAQELWNVPPGLEVPAGRTKPWGTAHAVLAAADYVQGPFAVANADDFYGAAAYARLAAHLTETAASETPEFALVGYRLEETLSPSGGVSRGICTVGEDDYVESAMEIQDIRREGDRILGTTPDGKPHTLGGAELVSMNLWGFTPAIFPVLEQLFTRFVLEHATDPHGEFIIGDVVSSMVSDGQARLKALRSEDKWAGLTYPDDKTSVTVRLRELVSEGAYPEDLAAWFPAQRRES
jgi:dTDP-glucose pyrophosphorylase